MTCLMGLALEFAHSNYSNSAAFLAVCSPALVNPANHAGCPIWTALLYMECMDPCSWLFAYRLLGISKEQISYLRSGSLDSGR